MKKGLWILLVSAAITPGVSAFQRPAAQRGPSDCRIVDVTFDKTGEVDYVDGMGVPAEVGLLNSLRQHEKSSPRSCLLVFVPLATTIRTIEDLRVIAGKMQYQEFHLYVYEKRYRDSVNELVFGSAFKSDELRSGAHGPLRWPDRGPMKE